MACTVDQLGFEIDYWEAGKHTRGTSTVTPFLDTRHEFFRYRTTDNTVLEHEAGTRLTRFKYKLHTCELTRTAGLFLMRVVTLVGLCNRFSIRNLRCTDIGVYFELSSHPIDNDVEMLFPSFLDHL